MLDYDRVSCVLELLKSFDHGSKIASKLIQNYFRSNKNIGSKDRKFISNCFWNIIKHRNKINWHLKNHNIKVNFERQIILELFFLFSFFIIVIEPFFISGISNSAAITLTAWF